MGSMLSKRAPPAEKPKIDPSQKEELEQADPRAALTSILSKRAVLEEESGNIPSSKEGTEQADPRAALMSALSKRAPPAKEPTMAPFQKEELEQANPKAALTSMLSSGGTSSSKDGTEQADGAPKISEDPRFAKYFKMIAMGLSMGAVKNAIQRDQQDPSIMDLDPGKSLESQQSLKSKDSDDIPLKDDPIYSKYFKMSKMGLPLGAVKNAMQRDGLDPSIMDLDPEKTVASQLGDEEDNGPPLKDDPLYSKYFKMSKMGLPLGAVQNAMQRDGIDPSIMDLDPEKSVASQLDTKEEPVDDGPPLKDDPTYVKYFKMLKMGLPMGAVKNAMERDGLNASIMHLDPG